MIITRRHKLILTLVILIVLALTSCQKGKQEQGQNSGLSGTITLSGAWALYPMAVRWAEEFQKLHPNVRIDNAAGGAGKGMADALAQFVDLGMVSRDIYSEEVQKGACWVSVTKDAVVPTANNDIPLLEMLLKNGISSETLKKIWIIGEIRTWGQAIGSEKSLTKTEFCDIICIH